MLRNKKLLALFLVLALVLVGIFHLSKVNRPLYAYTEYGEEPTEEEVQEALEEYYEMEYYEEMAEYYEEIDYYEDMAEYYEEIDYYEDMAEYYEYQDYPPEGEMPTDEEAQQDYDQATDPYGYSPAPEQEFWGDYMDYSYSTEGF